MSGSVEGLASGRDERAEGGGLADREVGEDLAVDIHLRGLQAGDELRVRHLVLAARGVDAHAPEAPELTFARAPVTVRIPERVHDLLVRSLEVAAARTGVAPRRGEDCPAVLLSVDGTLHACHVALLSEQALDPLAILTGDLGQAAEPARAARRLLLEQVIAVRVTPADLAGRRELE